MGRRTWVLAWSKLQPVLWAGRLTTYCVSVPCGSRRALCQSLCTAVSAATSCTQLTLADNSSTLLLQAKKMVEGLQITTDKDAARQQIKNFYKLFTEKDCTMVEVCM